MKLASYLEGADTVYGVIVARSDHVGERIALDPFVVLVDGIERAARAFKVAEPLALDDRVIVAAWCPLTLDLVLVHDALEFAQSRPHHPRERRLYSASDPSVRCGVSMMKPELRPDAP